MLSVVGFFGREFDSPRLHHFYPISINVLQDSWRSLAALKAFVTSTQVEAARQAACSSLNAMPTETLVLMAALFQTTAVPCLPGGKARAQGAKCAVRLRSSAWASLN